MSFVGKRALITGSTTGIGRRVAELLNAQGAEVIISGRDGVRGAAVVGDITNRGGSARFVPVELADAASVGALAAQAGPVDVLINNAGIFPFAPTVDQDLAELDRVLAINVRAPFLLTAQLAPAMLARGGGAIVNVSTAAAEIGLAGTAAYAASKAALTALTRTWASEFGPAIRVNTVAPGPTLTENVLATVGADQSEQMAAASHLGRAGRPEEISAAIVFLASDAASFITGATVPVDGGMISA